MPILSSDVNGIAMRWEEHGEGPDVIFIHSLPTSPLVWRYVIPELTDVRSLAWEMVGYGDSLPAGDGRDLSIARQATYLLAWMDRIGIDGAVLVGHDLGGGVAQILAVNHPDRVRGLVLANSVCYDAWPIPEVRILRALAPLVRRLPDIALLPIFAVLFLRGHSRLDQAREALRVHAQYYLEHGSTHRFIRQVEALNGDDTARISDRLPSLDIPAHIVWGAADPFLELSYGEHLAADLKAPIDIILSGKHFVPEDHPMHIVAAVRRVLALARGNSGRK